MRKMLLTAALMVVASFSVGLATAASPSAVVRSGNLEVTFGEGFAPKGLSRTDPTPVALHLWSQVKSIDGSRPAALTEFVIDTDQNSTIDVGGLPTCSRGQRDIREANPNHSCIDAIVGRGAASFDIQFPEEGSIPTRSDLVIYNGGVKAGVTTLYARAYLTQPITTEVVMPIQIEGTRRGRFASRTIVTMPKIANGAGSLTSFSATIKRSFTRKGKWVSVVAAKCPAGKLYSRVEANFVDGTGIQSPLVSSCAPRD